MATRKIKKTKPEHWRTKKKRVEMEWRAKTEKDLQEIGKEPSVGYAEADHPAPTMIYPTVGLRSDRPTKPFSTMFTITPEGHMTFHFDFHGFTV